MSYTIMAALGGALVFGLGPFMYKRMLGEVSVSQMLLLTSTMFCVASLLFWLCATGGRWECMTDGATALGVLAGAGVLFLGYYLFFTALQDSSTNTAVVSAITHASVVVTLAVSWLIFQETLSVWQGLGVVLIVCGCVMTTLSG